MLAGLCAHLGAPVFFEAHEPPAALLFRKTSTEADERPRAPQGGGVDLPKSSAAAGGHQEAGHGRTVHLRRRELAMACLGRVSPGHSLQLSVRSPG